MACCVYIYVKEMDVKAKVLFLDGQCMFLMESINLYVKRGIWYEEIYTNSEKKISMHTYRDMWWA